MKKLSIILILTLMLGIIMVSGCTDNTSNVNRTTYGDYAERSTANGVDHQWQVHITKSSPFLDTANVNTITQKVQPNAEDTEKGYTNIQTGNRTINGFTVYYKTYTKKNNDLEGMFYFEKKGKWYLISWNDQQGNPNKNLIDSEIKYYMDKM